MEQLHEQQLHEQLDQQSEDEVVALEMLLIESFEIYYIQVLVLKQGTLQILHFPQSKIMLIYMRLAWVSPLCQLSNKQI